ncbi:ATP-binding protein [Actimicrobium antarcticum]|uniref:NadR/Ttd14 AAA domain-containing protein n=1 Tax=Actimicrobium antarcticum TaxID=1051899 RepID=A0ABP7TNB7_9BURK
MAAIAILGAESTGKSTLAAALATRHQTLWVPEYLREFVDMHQRTPHEDEQFLIASRQVAREDTFARDANRWLFCDTTPLMTALYSQFYFGRVDAALAALAASRRYALTFVTAPDTPWIADGLQRESADVRDTVHQCLIAQLMSTGSGFHLLSGTLEKRLVEADRLLEISAGK